MSSGHELDRRETNASDRCRYQSSGEIFRLFRNPHSVALDGASAAVEPDLAVLAGRRNHCLLQTFKWRPRVDWDRFIVVTKLLISQRAVVLQPLINSWHRFSELNNL